MSSRKTETLFSVIDRIYMFFFIQASLIGLATAGYVPPYLALILPTAYISLMGFGTFKGGSVDPEELARLLSARWNDSEELAAYMRKYWYALRYSASATARQRNCMTLALSSFIGAAIGWTFTDERTTPYLLLIVGGVLWGMAARINRPLSMYKDSRVRNSDDDWGRAEWRNAVSSMVAFAELYPQDENYSYLAGEILKDPVARGVIISARRN